MLFLSVGMLSKLMVSSLARPSCNVEVFVKCSLADRSGPLVVQAGGIRKIRCLHSVLGTSFFCEGVCNARCGLLETLNVQLSPLNACVHPLPSVCYCPLACGSVAISSQVLGVPVCVL